MRCRAALALCLTVLPVACSRGQRGSTGRIALVRFENLSGDQNLDWLAAGIPGTLGAQLATSSKFVALPVAAEPDVYAVRATTALYGYYSVQNNRLTITADLRDIERQKTVRTIQATSDAAAGSVALIDRIARELAGGPVEPFGTNRDAAAREFWIGARAQKPEEAEAHLTAAVEADPGFVLAHIALAERAVATGDAQTAAAQIRAASHSSTPVSPYVRARLALVDANLRGDNAAREQALVNITRIAPANEQAWTTLAELQLARKDYSAAIQSLQRALEIDDRNRAALNSLGYAYAFAGNLEAAKNAFEQYRRVEPEDANALDSLGDVQFYFGHFSEAERYYLDAHKLNPSLLSGGDLYKAAVSRFYGRDQSSADASFATFLEFRKRAGDPILTVREAVWEAQTGRRDAAQKRLQHFLSRTDIAPEVRLVASAQLDLFNSGTGQRFVPLSGQATLPQTRALAQLAAYLSQPDASPAEWQRRSAGMSPQALGYALLLYGHFAEAVPVWERLYAGTNPIFLSDTRVMLAWAYSKTGRGADARKILTVRPLPPRMAEPGLSFLTFEKDQALRQR